MNVKGDFNTDVDVAVVADGVSVISMFPYQTATLCQQ